jgi:protein-tyrosine phosphatase
LKQRISETNARNKKMFPRFNFLILLLDFLPKTFRNPLPLYSRFLLLQKAAREEQIDITLYPGAEILCLPQTVQLARDGSLPTLGDSRCVLLEFHFDTPAEVMDALLDGIAQWDYLPVVAHPERYPFVQREADLAEDWVHQGCLLQANQGSLTGSFGMEAALCARQLLSRGLVAAVASDAHSPQHRSTDLRPAVQWMEQMRVPAATAKLLLSENPLRILQGKAPVMPEPLLL